MAHVLEHVMPFQANRAILCFGLCSLEPNLIFLMWFGPDTPDAV